MTDADTPSRSRPRPSLAATLLGLCLVVALAPPVHLVLVQGSLAGAAAFVLGSSLLVIASIAILLRRTRGGRS